MTHLIRSRLRPYLPSFGLLGTGLAVLAAVSCGGPQTPSDHTEPGPLAAAMTHLAKETGPSPAAEAIVAPVPYVVIRFDRPGILFEDTLYAALTRAFDRDPAAQFDVVLAMPPLTPAGDPGEAMRQGEQHIEDVVLAMTDMGLPSDRLRIAASTETDAAVDEIRIFVR